MNGLSNDTKQFFKAQKKHFGMKYIIKTSGLADPSTLQGGFLFAVIFAFLG
jgi:hypothetical protein